MYVCPSVSESARLCKPLNLRDISLEQKGNSPPRRRNKGIDPPGQFLANPPVTRRMVIHIPHGHTRAAWSYACRMAIRAPHGHMQYYCEIGYVVTPLRIESVSYPLPLMLWLLDSYKRKSDLYSCLFLFVCCCNLLVISTLRTFVKISENLYLTSYTYNIIIIYNARVYKVYDGAEKNRRTCEPYILTNLLL